MAKTKKFQTPSNLPSFCHYLQEAILDENKANKEYHAVKMALPEFFEEGGEQFEVFVEDAFHHIALQEKDHERVLTYIYQKSCEEVMAESVAQSFLDEIADEERKIRESLENLK